LSSAGKGERKTRLRTLRFSESLARSLEKEAADEGTTVNALTNSIIGGYFDWVKKAREFGFVAVHKPVFVSLFEELDDKTLIRIGRDVMTTSWKEMAEFWFQDSTPDKILDALSMRSKFDSKIRTSMTREEGVYTIVFHHDFGPKWSIVLKSALQEFVRKSFLVEPRVSAGESVVTARFRVNPRKLHA
jgi:hypothetical protein